MILTQLIVLSYSNYNLVPVHTVAQAYIEQYNICFDCDCPLTGDFAHSQPTMVHSLLNQLPGGFTHSHSTMVYSLLNQLPGGFTHSHSTMVYSWQQPATGSSYWQC